MHVNESATKRTRVRRTPSDAPIPILRPSDEQIRARAYDIFLRRGGRPGDPVQDWFSAERELVSEAPAVKSEAPALKEEAAALTEAPALKNEAPAVKNAAPALKRAPAPKSDAAARIDKAAAAPAKRTRKPRS
jgi:hypothetical protein